MEHYNTRLVTCESLEKIRNFVSEDMSPDDVYEIECTIDNLLSSKCLNCHRSECDSLDHAAQVFARETGIEMPENPTDSAMMLWMNSLCKWLFEEYKGGASE